MPLLLLLQLLFLCLRLLLLQLLWQLRRLLLLLLLHPAVSVEEPFLSAHDPQGAPCRP
jgi:hypothetical protein